MNSTSDLNSSSAFGMILTGDDYKEIGFDDSMKEYQDFTHASHCMIYANSSKEILDTFTPKATILMQMRFDGYLGFPGGVVDSGESVIEALERELDEEMGSLTDHRGWTISMDDHVLTQVSAKRKLVFHFFSKLVDLDTILLIETAALNAKDYGSEVMGVFRVPLYTMEDGFRGLPAFLTNVFIGNAKYQLLTGILTRNILSQTDIEKALNAKSNL